MFQTTRGAINLKRSYRRLIFAGLPVSLLTTVITGCGTSNANVTAGQGGKVTITFMETMVSGTQKPALQALVTKFEASHKNITVKLIGEPDFNTLHASEEAAIAAGSPPTMAQVYMDWAATYVKNGLLAPLGPYINGTNGLSKSEQSAFYPAIWDSLKLSGGKIWAMPFNTADLVMYYNKTWLSRLNDPVPTTLQQFQKTAASAVSASSNTWGLTIDPGSTSGPQDGTFVFVAVLRALGGHLVKDGHPTFNTPQAQTALRYIQQLYQSGILKTGTNYPGSAALEAGRSLFQLGTSAAYPYNVQGIGNRFAMAVAPFPNGPGNRPGNVMRGSNIVLFSNASSVEKNAAWTFMKWVTAPKQVAYWSEQTGYIPISKTATTLMRPFIATHPIFQATIASLPDAKEIPPIPGMTQALGSLGNAIQEVLTAHMPISQALRTAQSAAVSEVAKH